MAKNKQKHVFLTGATGFIGQRLALVLAEEECMVHAYVRNPEKAARLLNHPGIRVFNGSLFDRDKLQEALNGCCEGYHVAGLTEPAVKDQNEYFRINCEGTQSVLQAARDAGLQKMVVTSTAGVFGPSVNGEAIHENSTRTFPWFNAYEESKHAMEEWIAAKNLHPMEVVIVNPTRVYGPGEAGKDLPLNRLIRDYAQGNWHWLPGNGRQSGNYVFIDDVVQGHILAMQRGTDKEIYLLGGENATYRELFRTIDALTGKRHRLWRVPLRLVLMGAYGLKLFSFFGYTPPVTPPWVRRYFYEWIVDSAKARDGLGLVFTSLKKGLQKTLEWEGLID